MSYFADYRLAAEKAIEVLEDSDITQAPILLRDIIRRYSGEISVVSYTKFMRLYDKTYVFSYAAQMSRRPSGVSTRPLSRSRRRRSYSSICFFVIVAITIIRIPLYTRQRMHQMFHQQIEKLHPIPRTKRLEHTLLLQRVFGALPI